MKELTDSRLAVVVLNWRTHEQTQALINSIKSWERLNPIIIVVDNESSSEDTLHVPDNVGVVLRSNKNLGYGGGNNLGIQYALSQNADYILLLNPDVELHESVVISLIDVLIRDQMIFAVGPKLIEKNGFSERTILGGRNIAKYVNTRVYEEDQMYETSSDHLQVDYTVGAIISLDARKVKEIGIFDEHFFFSGEVADLCYRAISAGYSCITNLTVSAIHDAGESHLRKTMYLYYNLRNRFLFMRKHKAPIAQRLFWYQIVIRRLLGAFLNLRFSEFRGVVIALYHIIGRKYGNQNHLFVKR